jgi:predicted dithiol-disulfide oxidoreductase (DUF899 family)
MEKYHEKRFPEESQAYRNTRNELLAAEIALRKQLEEVAALRRKLPLGGKLKENYVFEEGTTDLSDQITVKSTKFSELFEKGKNSLIIYSFMYAPEADKPCPLCTSILDGLNGNAPHVKDRVNFVVVAKAPIQKIRRWAAERGWKNLRLLSSGKNTYNADYFAENSPSQQLPALNVFAKTAEGIYHFYNTELLYSPTETGQNPRHVDLVWPLWNMFDLTLEGRGTNWFPKFSY